MKLIPCSFLSSVLCVQGGGGFGGADNAKKRLRMAKMRYSEIPTDYSCDNLAALRINEV
jgi:hypothetical protein